MIPLPLRKSYQYRYRYLFAIGVVLQNTCCGGATPTSRTIFAYYGRPPVDAFPLNLCQGDCRDDTECGPGLYCFQRDPNEPIPGCLGGADDNSRTDYCTDVPPTTEATLEPSEKPTDADQTDIPTQNPIPAPKPLYAFPGSPPTNAYPLQQCQGDCQYHSDCDVGMFCFQRDPFEPVPGCLDGDKVGSKTDFCTYSPPVVAPAPPPTQDDFRIKMYWDESYYWQEVYFERPWCLSCKDDECHVGEVLFLKECAWDNTRFDFLEVSAVAIQIQVLDTSLCIERNEDATSLQSCDAENVLQHWTATNGSFTGERFELSQHYNNDDYCATTHHHPKYGEILEMYPCSVARFDTTSFWNKH